MSSHLTISYTSGTGTPVTKALNSGQETGDDALKGIAGLFASLLGGRKTDTAAPDATDTTQSSQTTAEVNLAGLIGLSLNAGTDDAADASDDEPTTDPTVDPSTVVVPQVIAALPTAAQQPAADLVQSLTELGAALSKGGTPSTDLLDKLNKQLDAVAQALGVPTATTPSFNDALAQATAALPADASLDAKFDQKLAALAVGLVTPAPAADGETDAPSVSQQAQDVAAKLAALAKSLGDGTLSAETLSKLGLKADGATTEPALQKAIANLVGSAPAANASATIAATVAAPTLAAPALKISETAITGKAKADATANATGKSADPTTTADTGTTKLAPATSPTPTVTPADGQAASSDGKDKDTKKSDVAGIAAAVAGKVADDAAATTPNAAQAGVQTTAKIEAPAAAKAAPTVYQTSQQQINVPQIAFEMVRQAQHGNSRFQIRLDPPELGRIDVHLAIDNTGQVNARMMVEKAETLDLMQRDQRSLQQALQQAGLDASKTNLEFSLRQNNSGQQQQGQSGDRFPAFGDTAKADDTPAPAINLYRGNLSASGVNIFA